MYDLRHMRADDFEGLDEEIITKEINDGYTKLYEECFFKTLYEKVPKEFKLMLNKQYRCHSHIMEVFNHFYGGSNKGLIVGKKQQDDEKEHNLTVRINGNVRYGKAYCFSHYIAASILDEIVLEDIREMARRVTLDEKAIREEFIRHNAELADNAVKSAKKELQARRKRTEEISRLIQVAYEDRVKGKMPEDI